MSLVKTDGLADGVKAATLPALLRQQAAEKPDVVHLYIRADDGRFGPVTFGQLQEGAEQIARVLQARGIRTGDFVGLMLPGGHEFFYSFLGVTLAGAVPVPIYPPMSASYIEDYADRQSNILRNAGVRALITFRQAERLARLLKPQIPTLSVVARVESLLAGSCSTPLSPVEPADDDLAFLQYTSGSTGTPKGVMLTHANVISNIRAIGHGVAVQPDDVVVSWLPLYHDMGLIGCWLFALFHGLPMVSLSPLEFLRRPERWLWALHAYGGTLSPAPNFAYELCVRKVAEDEIEGLDLSRWRVALNGAEPVNPGTLQRFQQRYGRCGFRTEAMMPVYGLAENTVALCFHALGRPPRVDRVDRETFQARGRAVPATSREEGGNGSEDDCLKFVSVGRPILAHEIRIADDDGNPAGERIEGHVEFCGPSATPGYYRSPEATRAILAPDGWVRTGDLGYVAEDDLFITGRSKDLIIKGGRNIYPQEVEAVAAEVNGIRAGCVAAFSVPDLRAGTEGMVVVAETRQTQPEIHRELAARIRRRVSTAVKISPDDIRIVPPHTIPKTPSGKLRRAECRRLYLANELTAARAPVWIQLARLSLGSVWAALRQGLGRGRQE